MTHSCSIRVSCTNCHKETSLLNINNHYNACIKKPVDLKCRFCGKEYLRYKLFLTHEKTCTHNPNKIEKTERKNISNQYIKAKKLGLPSPEISEETRLKFSASSKNQIWTDERRKNHSETMKIAVKENPNSYNKNNVSGRVKLIEYNGTSLKGSWELKTAIWLDSLNVSWNHEVNPQKYYWNDDWHLYFPDFYLEKYNAHIEVKGYKTKRDDAKWAQFNGTLAIIDRNNIQILDSYKSIEHFIESCKL